MSIPIHQVDITLDELRAVMRGDLVEAMTDKDMQVQIVLADLFDQTPGRNGVQVIPINDGMVQELFTGGNTGWVPTRSPYVFGIAVHH